MDIHNGMRNVTQESLRAAHQKDVEQQASEQVRFITAWADPKAGKVFCLSEAPNKEAVQRVYMRAGHPANEIYELAFEES
jgi:hypothetical protein